MSLETWKKEFYPVEADSPEAQASARAAIEHSLRKWRGLRPEALLKHEVRLEGPYNKEVVDDCADAEDESQFISSRSCALCIRFDDADGNCDGCPIVKVSGMACDLKDEDERGPDASAWEMYIYYADPEPMIAQLEKALALVSGDKDAA